MDSHALPPRYPGPFHWGPSLGIERAHYIALGAADPAAAARFAVEHMGLYLVHVDAGRRHYLAGHGHDAYSLVYAPGDNGSVDHISYLVRSVSALAAAARRLEAAGVEVDRVEASDLWRHGPAVRFRFPAGQTIELSTGVNLDRPMGQIAPTPRVTPGPISFDHVIVKARELAAAFEFTARTMGLRESGRIVAATGVPILGFFRCHTLYHCFGLAHADHDGLHHYQLTLKDSHAVIAAFERMKAGGKVEVVWGPLRHGPGQNVAIYFHDWAGNVVEYSAEEEIILDEDSYPCVTWPATDLRTADEWHRTLPPWAPAHQRRPSG